MSKIGKKSINVPDNVQVKIGGGSLEFNGSNGSLSIKIPSYIKTEIRDKTVSFYPENSSKETRAKWGTIRALASNAIIGVTKGFEKVLEVEGIGYRANMEGNILILSIGFSHPIKFNPPEGIKISVEKNSIKISGFDKALVGQVAAQIRAFKKPEPYKGKGIRYQGEIIRRKAGKKMAATTK